jgi:triosephosphate isomerase
MRTPFIAANWKMHKTVLEAVAFIKEFRSMAKDVFDVEIVVAPPFTALRPVADAAHASNIGVAGQNVHWERQGAFTGEISAGMLKEAGAEYVIIGHSERRQLFGETDETVNRKLTAAVAAQLTPIVCIGETLAQRDANETLAVLDRQIKQGLDGLTADQIAALVIAYEPVWAIGTGRNATPADAAQVHRAIRRWLSGRGIPTTRVLYGGSVNLKNVAELLAEPEVDGVLVGGASLDPSGWIALVRTGAP